MLFLKQSTAFTETFGPILDSTGAEYTGGVIGDLSISKNGTEAAMAAAATLTHTSNGHYALVGTTGNSDTLGRTTIRINKAGYQAPVKEYMVLPATVFDALVTNAAGGANGLLLSLASNQVDVGKLLGTAWLTPAVAGTPDVNAKQIGGQTASLNANNLLKVSLNDVLATALTESGAGRLAAAIKKFFDVATPASTMELLTAVTTLTTYTGNTPQTGDAFARLGAPAGASVSADLVAINAKTTNLPAAPASTTNITAGTIATVTNAVTTGAISANAITAAAFAADAGAEIADAVWDEVLSGHIGVGSAGLALAAAGALGSPLDAAGVRAAVGLASANLDTQIAAVKTDTAAVKVQTDKLVFTTVNKLDVGLYLVNGQVIIGTGTTIDPWRSA